MFKYLTNSDICVRLSLNPLKRENWVIPSYRYQGPNDWDNYRKTLMIVIPFMTIFLDLDCESFEIKTEKDRAKVLASLQEQELE